MKKEGCGIAGVALEQGNAALPIFYALYTLQHRGQESAGIAVCNGRRESEISLRRGMGFVYEVFDNPLLESLKGHVGIGHVRYSTTGASRVENAEPLLVDYRKGKIAIAHNGNLVNTEELREELKSEGRIFHSDTDTEVIAHLLVKELMRHETIEAVKELMSRLVGSYSLTILMDDTLIAIRDPFGIKPLCLGEIREGANGYGAGHVIASESTAVDMLDARLIRDVIPGEVLMVKEGDLTGYQLCRGRNTAHCVFEYIYFARADSILDGRVVYDVRRKIGERLAEEHGVEADMVSPVPDSGIAFAIGYAKRAGLDYMEGFMKNRYVGRTFIMPEEASRDTAVRLKLNVVRANVKGMRVVLVDDSIVRGTTSRRIVKYLKEKGAKEVHLRIGSPPIRAPCYLGINTPTREELVASKRNMNDICTFLNADSIGYLSMDGLIDSVGIAEDNLCLGCLTGKYPVEIPGEMCTARQLKLTHF
jgi:amidophosphoribosyltransferase